MHFISVLSLNEIDTLVTEALVFAEPPRVLHYGLLWEVKGHNYAFDKSWYKNFDPQQCGPWDMSAERPTAGLFPLPPSPSTFTDVTVRSLLLIIWMTLRCLPHVLHVLPVNIAAWSLSHASRCMAARVT